MSWHIKFNGLELTEDNRFYASQHISPNQAFIIAGTSMSTALDEPGAFTCSPTAESKTAFSLLMPEGPKPGEDAKIRILTTWAYQASTTGLDCWFNHDIYLRTVDQPLTTTPTYSQLIREEWDPTKAVAVHTYETPVFTWQENLGLNWVLTRQSPFYGRRAFVYGIEVQVTSNRLGISQA